MSQSLNKNSGKPSLGRVLRLRGWGDSLERQKEAPRELRRPQRKPQAFISAVSFSLAVFHGLGGLLPGEDPARTRGEAVV